MRGDREGLFTNDAFESSGGPSRHNSADAGFGRSSGEEEDMFVFDTEYIRRTRHIDRTVDFLRMRHVPSGFESIEHVAAEHAITVLLKLKYLQQRRDRQLEAYAAASAGSGGGAGANPPPVVPMSTKEEFILYALEKFTALIYAGRVASDAAERTAAIDDAPNKPQRTQHEGAGNGISLPLEDSPSRQKLWRSLPHGTDVGKSFLLVHEACGSNGCPAAVAKICLRLCSDQLFQRDDDGRLPLHRAACRGLGWEPPGYDVDAARASSADETLTLLKGVLSESHETAPMAYDNNRQLPLHCAVDSLVTSLVTGKRRRISLPADARVALHKHCHTHVEIAIECLSELLQANSSATLCRDGKTGLFPFMQAGMKREAAEEDDAEVERDHISVIYYLLRENPSVIRIADGS